MSSQVSGRKRTPNREKLTAEDDALSQIAREAEARLAAKRAARAEAREIRMKELERQQKEIYQAQKEDSERYSRHSRRHASISDDEERMSVGSRGSLRGNYSDLCSSTGSLPSSRLQNGRPSDYSGFLGSSSRASSRASSARASPVVEERSDFLEKGSRTASTLSAATLASLGGGLSRRGSCDTSISADTEASIREIKDSLVEVEEKYRKAMVSNAQLDNEKSNLMYQVDTLRDTLMELEELLYETRRECEERTKEYERERHAHSILQFQFSEMKEMLKQSEELLTDSQQLRVKQESNVREISDLQETLEWKEKKIRALERQKEYSDIVQDERNALRDEVSRLRDALKKHGIVLGSEATTNGETGNAIDAPEDEKSASRLGQDPHTPVMSGDSVLEGPPDDQSPAKSTPRKHLRTGLGSRSYLPILKRAISPERATSQDEGRRSAPEHKDIDVVRSVARTCGAAKEAKKFRSSNDKSRMQVQKDIQGSKACPEVEQPIRDEEKINNQLFSEYLKSASVGVHESQCVEDYGQEAAIQEPVKCEEPSQDKPLDEASNNLNKKEAVGDVTQMEKAAPLLNLREDLPAHQNTPNITGHHSHTRREGDDKTVRDIEMAGTSKSCEDPIKPWGYYDLEIIEEDPSLSSEQEPSETESEDVQDFTLPRPVEEKGIAMFLDSCQEAGAIDFDFLTVDTTYMRHVERLEEAPGAGIQTKRMKTKKRNDCSVS